MATTGSLFSQTLQDITTTKLDELAKKFKSFEDAKATLLARVSTEQDGVSMLTVLADGVKSCFDVSLSATGRVVRGSTHNPRLEIDLNNLDRFTQQARYDPSISVKFIDQWRQSLMRHLEIQSLKFSFASLYGQLTTEWLQTKQAAAVVTEKNVDTDGFEHVSTSKKLESRSKWEQAVFQPAMVDEADVAQLLRETFDTSSEETKPLKTALETLREQVTQFEQTLASPHNFDITTLQWTITGLVASDLLTDEKRAVLKDFASNHVVITEIADVLNMRIAALGTWSWGTEVPLEQRRQLNGTYKIHMHEDLLQAIFLQYIGVKWSVFWKRALRDLRKTKSIWKSPRTAVTLLDRKRRDFYLGPNSRISEPNVQSARQKIYRQSYFLSRLLDTEEQQIEHVEGEEEANCYDDQECDEDDDMGFGLFDSDAPEPHQQVGQKRADLRYFKGGAKRHRKILRDTPERDIDDERDDAFNLPKNLMEDKQSILHLLSTEIMIKTRLYGEISCFRSQVDNLYSSMPHVTVQAVLQFFGVGPKWLSFFMRFLQTPLRFMDDSTPRLRKRGTPESHALSDVFGELVLFCLDFKINQITDGEMLWRLHDDLWFWSSDHSRCIKAWTAVTSFAQTLGLSLNEGRTGSARMLQKFENGKRSMLAIPVEKPLPPGQIRWGMLYLNADSGRFEIDQSMVEKHIHDLARQLHDNDKSVFAWIQAWNTYATTFFTSNFGKPANCFGRKHVDEMLATHERIQRDVFSASMKDAGTEIGNVVAFLRHTIETRFGVKDIPDGYFFFPVELGGLEVQSPFIGLLQIRDSVLEHPEKLLDKFEEAELENYKLAIMNFEEGTVEKERANGDDPSFVPEDPTTFMPFEEFVKHREVLGYAFKGELVHVFNEMLRHPSEESVKTDNNGNVKIALNSLGNLRGLRGILSQFGSMEPYWKWVSQLYGPEMIERFGGFNMVDPGLLPVGMVSMLRSGKVKWQD